MKSVWTHRIKDKALCQTHINGLTSNPYLQQLREILKNREQEYLTKILSTPDGPAWAYNQAYLNGKLSDLREIIELLNFDQKE